MSKKNMTGGFLVGYILGKCYDTIFSGFSVAWLLRSFFIIMPLVFVPIYVAIRCFIWPLFFGYGIAGVFRGLLAKETLGMIGGFFFLLVVNVFYMRIVHFLGAAVDKFNLSLIDRIDRFYDRLLGGEYGRGCSTPAGMIIKRCVRLVCSILGLYCGYFIVGYFLWGEVFDHGLSWSAWMTYGGGERVNRWTTVIVFFMLFGSALLYAIERLVCGSLEKAGLNIRAHISKAQDDSIEIEVREEGGDGV